MSELLRALRSCGDDQALLLKFLRDLLVPEELTQMANRYAAATHLMRGASRTETARALGMDPKVVGRVAHWVHGPYATGGYWGVFDLEGRT